MKTLNVLIAGAVGLLAILSAGCSSLKGTTKGPAAESADKTSVWNGIWTDQGKLKVATDLKVFKTPPSSIRVESDGGPVNGSVSQELKNVAGKKLRVQGWVMFKGLTKCSVGIGSFDSSWKLLEWGSAFYADSVNELEWTSFDKIIEIPANAEKINLSLGITGEGSAWFGDIKVDEVKYNPIETQPKNP